MEAFENEDYFKYIKDPNVKARYKMARDKCAQFTDEKKKWHCFKRNWNIYKSHRSNKLDDVRARTQRACYKYKNHILPRRKCYARYVKEYEPILKTGILADQEEREKDVAEQFEDEVNGNSLAELNAEADYVNERELSSASSTDSDASSSSSENTSDDNSHRNYSHYHGRRQYGERRATANARNNAARPAGSTKPASKGKGPAAAKAHAKKAAAKAAPAKPAAAPAAKPAAAK